MATPVNQPDQRTIEWFQARIGHITASRVGEIVKRINGGKQYSAARQNYMVELAAERLTGVPCGDVFVSREMEWGIQQEPFARAAYEMAKNCMVDLVGFCEHPSMLYFGASPDGLVGSSGLLEIKVPKPATHIGYLLGGVVPDEYLPQVLAQQACRPERKWTDFVSFCPQMPKHLRLFTCRLDRNEQHIARLEDEVRLFNSEIDALIDKLNDRAK